MDITASLQDTEDEDGHWVFVQMKFVQLDALICCGPSDLLEPGPRPSLLDHRSVSYIDSTGGSCDQASYLHRQRTHTVQEVVRRPGNLSDGLWVRPHDPSVRHEDPKTFKVEAAGLGSGKTRLNQIISY